jgi:hypothetical protein
MTPIEQIKERLKKYPHLKFEESSDHIKVLPTNSSGFSVTLYFEKNEITVFYGDSWHEHFQNETEALNCFAFGLSKECRLKVFSRGNIEYKWVLEHFRQGQWIEDSTSGSLFFPFWLPKKVEFLQNNVIA